MRTILFSLFFIIFAFIFNVQGAERDELLRQLDKAVENRAYYMERKENRIDSLKKLIRPDLSLQERYRVNHEIYREYYTYRSDSAMRYVYDNLEIAHQEKNLFFQDRATIALSMLLSTTGLYLESIGNLGKINRSTLDDSLLPEYYFISEWTYNTAAEYSNDSLYAPRYNHTKGLYRDSLFALLPEGTHGYNYYKSKVYMAEGRMEEALELFLRTYEQLPVDTRLYAMVTYDISTIYKRFDNLELCEKFLILASISDQVCPLKENLAMQELSLYLFQYKPHDLERAYRYIQCSMEDARFYNNRLRIVQISEKLPVIVKAFQLANEKKQARLTLSLIVISLLSLLTVASIGYVYRQMRVVKKSRRQLSVLNEQLNRLNSSLQEANHTREEYVGLFMDLCSSYIEKLDRYREMVKRKITTGQVEDLYKLTSSRRTIEMEFDEFLHNFDRAFLNLYPGFVEELNKLLLEEHRIYVKKGELLTTELRIFSLIRLGISDSSKIAAFLRYSPQTIYNYRTRVKNGARGDRNTFEQDVMEIGSVGTYLHRC